MMVNLRPFICHGRISQEASCGATLQDSPLGPAEDMAEIEQEDGHWTMNNKALY